MSASILVSPSAGYHFNNSALGDLLIRGLNGGLSQKILLGTASNVDAVLSITPALVRLATTLALSNAYGEQRLYTSNANLGIGTSTPQATLDVAGNVAVNGTQVIDGAANLSNVGALTLAGPITLTSATNTAAIGLSSSNLTVNANILPTADVTYDLGSSNARFRDLYISGNTIHMGSNVLTTRSDGALLVKVTSDNFVSFQPAPILGSTVTAVATLSNSLGSKYGIKFTTRSNDGALLTSLTTFDSNGNSADVAGTASMLSAFYGNPTSGLAGVNNTNPKAQLDVAGNTIVGGALALSNLNGQGALFSSYSNLGVNTSNPSVALDVTGAAKVSGTAVVTGALTTSNAFIAQGAATLSNGLTVFGGSTILSNAVFTSSNLRVQGATSLSNGLVVYAAPVALSNATTISSNLGVQGLATLSNGLTVYGGATALSNNVTTSGTLGAAGLATLSNGLNVYGGPVALSNNVTTSGTLGVAGTATMAGALNVVGAATASNGLGVSGALNVTGATVLSNTVTTYGITSFSNMAYFSSNMLVNGGLTVNGPLTLAQATTANGNFGVGCNLNVGSNLYVTGDTYLSGILNTSNNATFASNLTVLGSLNATSMNIAYSNVTVYTSEEIRSNLTVDNAITACNGITNFGATVLSNTVVTYGLASVSNALLVTSNLSVAGAASLSNGLTVYGAPVALSNATTISSNLTVAGAASLSNAVNIYGIAAHSNAAYFSSNVTVTGVTALSNAVNIYGIASLSNAAYCSSNVTVAGVTALSNAVNIYGIAAHSNAAFFSSNVTVTGVTALSNAVNMYGITAHSNAAYFSSNVTVTGAAALSNAVSIYGIAALSNATFFSSNVTVAGAASLSNGLTVYGGATALSNNATVSGTLGVVGTATMAGALNVVGAATASNGLGVSGAVNATGALTALGAALLSNGLTVYAAPVALSNATTISSNLSVAGLSTLSNGLTVYGGVTALSNAATVSGTLGVAGLALLNNQVTITSNITLSPQTQALRKVVLWSNADNEFQFTGFGASNSNLRYQAVDSNHNHVFYCGSNTTGVIELMRLTGAGRLGLGTNNPAATLDVTGTANVSSNLTALGPATLSNGLTVYAAPVALSNATTISSNLTVAGATALSNTVAAYGITSLSNATYISSNLTLTGAASLSNTVAVYGIASLSNATYVSSNLTVTGATSLSNALTVYGISAHSNAAYFSSNVTVTGATALSNTVVMYGIQSHSNAAYFSSNVTVTGAASLSNGLTVYGGATALSNATTVSGTLGVAGQTLFNNQVTVMSNINLTPNANASRKLVLYSNADNDHQFSGFGINPSILRYQLGDSNGNHVFYAGCNATASMELMRLTGTGRLGVGTSTPGSTLDVAGTANVSGAATMASTLNVVGAVTASNGLGVSGPLNVTGATVLSNTVATYGITSMSNMAYFSSNVRITGGLTVDGPINLAQQSSATGNFSVGSNLYVTGDTYLSGILNTSNNATFASNLTVLGSLNATSMNIAYSNVTVYTSEEIRSNLTVDNAITACNGLTNFGATMLSNAVDLYGPLTMHHTINTISFSNSLGIATLTGRCNFIGIDMAGGSNPAYTLDVNGDINFSGKIYQNGSIFSGWNSNAYGNYINSNAAFKGPTTSNDVLLVYSYASNTDASNMPVSISNASGKTSLWGLSNRLGLGTASNPGYTLDVGGDINFSGKIYQNGSIFSGWNSNAYGNYINSNAAFKGQTTSNDVLLLYSYAGTADSSNLSFAISNASGRTALWGLSNRLGLGLASNPTGLLHVAGSETTAAGQGAAITLQNTASTTSWYLRAGAAGTQTPNGGFSIGDPTAYRLVIDSNGRTRVGSRVPFFQPSSAYQSLCVTPAASGVCELGFEPLAESAGSNAQRWWIYTASNNMAMGSQTGGNSITITSNNLVGIGMGAALPAYTLDTNGIARVTGTNGGAGTGLLIGTSTDTGSARFISALDNTMTNTSIRYIAFGKSNSASNQAEIAYQHYGDGSSNAMNFGFYGAVRATLVANGNFGIGTSNPLTTLTSYGTITGVGSNAGGAYSAAMLRNGGATAGTAANLDFGLNNDSVAGASVQALGDTAVGRHLAFLVRSNNTTVSTVALERMRLTSSGQLGVGTTTPSNALQVVGAVQAGGSQANSNVPALVLRNDAGGTNAAVSLDMYTYNTETGPSSRVATVDTGSSGAHLLYYTKSNGTLSNQQPTERMRITSEGLVGIGTNNPAHALDVVGDIHTPNGGFFGSNASFYRAILPNADFAVAGDAIIAMACTIGSNLGVGTTGPAYPVDVQANVNGVSVNCSAKVVATEFSVFSDRRIKTNVTTRDPAEYLSAATSLPVREFGYVDAFEKGAGTRIGFIAQEVEAVLPSCVDTVGAYLPNVFAALRVIDEDAAAKQVSLDLGPLPAAQRALLTVGALVKLRTGQAAGLASLGKVIALSEDEQAVGVQFDSMAPAKADDGTLFVVGTKVDDFKMLNQERLNCVAVGAIQAQQARIAALESQVAQILAQLRPTGA